MMHICFIVTCSPDQLPQNVIKITTSSCELKVTGTPPQTNSEKVPYVTIIVFLSSCLTFQFVTLFFSKVVSIYMDTRVSRINAVHKPSPEAVGRMQYVNNINMT